MLGDLQLPETQAKSLHMGALIVTYTILGVPYYEYNGPQNPILFIKAQKIHPRAGMSAPACIRGLSSRPLQRNVRVWD